MQHRSGFLSSIGAAVLLFAASAAAQSQDTAAWPSRPITIIVPTSPGSAGDVWARLYSQVVMQNNPGWRMLVDFKPGAGATLGAAYVAKAPPDGYTLLQVSSTLTTAPLAYKNLAFDPVKSFAPISLFSNTSSMLMINPALPVKNFQEYVAYAKANPGRINFGNSGIGSTYHLSSISLHQMMGIEVTHVPYKGSGDVTNALVSGEIQAMFGSLTVNLPFVKSGKARALAVTTAKRSTQTPDLPTLQELGATGFEHNAWSAIVAPAATPPAIVNRLSREFIKAGNQPEIISRLAASGQDSGGSTPEVLGRIIADETAKWRRLAQESNLQVQPE